MVHASLNKHGCYNARRDVGVFWIVLLSSNNIVTGSDFTRRMFKQWKCAIRVLLYECKGECTWGGPGILEIKFLFYTS